VSGGARLPAPVVEALAQSGAPGWDRPLLVLTSGVPRSGTSWLDRIARALIRCTGTSLSSASFEGGRDDDFPTNAPGDPEELRLRKFVATGRVRHAAKTHFLSSAPSDRGDVRLLYAWRDPRDVVLSTCWYALAGPAAEAFGGMGQAEAFEAVTNMVLPPLARSLRGAVDAPESTLLVRYAALVSDAEGEIGRIARHLGIDASGSLIAALADALSFRVESGRPAGDEDRSSYFRKGVIGGWEDDLPEAQRAQIDAALPDREALMDALDSRSR
jgi:hypothetical protein